MSLFWAIVWVVVIVELALWGALLWVMAVRYLRLPDEP